MDSRRQAAISSLRYNDGRSVNQVGIEKTGKH